MWKPKCLLCGMRKNQVYNAWSYHCIICAVHAGLCCIGHPHYHQTCSVIPKAQRHENGCICLNISGPFEKTTVLRRHVAGHPTLVTKYNIIPCSMGPGHWIFPRWNVYITWDIPTAANLFVLETSMFTWECRIASITTSQIYSISFYFILGEFRMDKNLDKFEISCFFLFLFFESKSCYFRITAARVHLAGWTFVSDVGGWLCGPSVGVHKMGCVQCCVQSFRFV